MNIKRIFDIMGAIFAGSGSGYFTGVRDSARRLEVAEPSSIVRLDDRSGHIDRVPSGLATPLLFIEPLNLRHGSEFFK